MTAPRSRTLAGLAGAVLTAALGIAALEVPYLGGRVNDLANMLSDGFEAGLTQQLETLERETGAQVVVLTVATLDGDPLEDFAIRVAETWRLGREGVDDGVLLLIARDERQVRIEVGYGLEGALPDALARRIITGLITPRFRSGDFDGGVEAAVTAIGAAVRGEELDLPDGGDQTQTGFTVVMMLFFFLLLFHQALRTPGGAGWFLYLFLTPFLFVFPAALAGLIAGVVATAAWLVLFPILRIFWPKGPSRRSGRGGWGPIWTGGGGFSGGGISGGFSGGGGSFGGGGASGGW